MTNIVLFGKPGAGKGTQAEFLKEKYKLTHISTGDLFRYNIKNETALGLEAKSYIDKGSLVPDSVTINMLKDAVINDTNTNGYLFDGFPRNIAQAEALDAFLASRNTGVTATIELEADDEVLVQRILERGKTSGRPDDNNEETLRYRYVVYRDETAPLADYYKGQGKFHAVNGTGSIAEITERLSGVIDIL